MKNKELFCIFLHNKKNKISIYPLNECLSMYDFAQKINFCKKDMFNFLEVYTSSRQSLAVGYHCVVWLGPEENMKKYHPMFFKVKDDKIKFQEFVNDLKEDLK